MTPIAAYEAENTLDSLLDRAEAGEQILITRHGKPVARLIPEGFIDVEKAEAAGRRIREMAEARKTGPFNWEEWKAYRDEGRR
jgi:prevent-host-death family protein